MTTFETNRAEIAKALLNEAVLDKAEKILSKEDYGIVADFADKVAKKGIIDATMEFKL